MASPPHCSIFPRTSRPPSLRACVCLVRDDTIPPAKLWPRACVHPLCPCSILAGASSTLPTFVKGRSRTCAFLRPAAPLEHVAPLRAPARPACALYYAACYCSTACSLLLCVFCTYHYSLPLSLSVVLRMLWPAPPLYVFRSHMLSTLLSYRCSLSPCLCMIDAALCTIVSYLYVRVCNIVGR